MLFKVTYSYFCAETRTLYIASDDADSIPDYLQTQVMWWSDCSTPIITHISWDDPDYIAWESKRQSNTPYYVPSGWITRVKPDTPIRYYYRHVSSIGRDFTQLRWVATQHQQDIIDREGNWTEITRTEARRMAREAAKQDTSYYPHNWTPDDAYIYPVNDDYSGLYDRLLRYHKRIRTADYTD